MPRPTRSRLTGSAKLRLTALLEGRVAGHVFQMGNGRLAFRYDDAWRSRVAARYGSAPQVTFYDSQVTVDSSSIIVG